MDNPVSWAALGLSILTAVYAIFASTPKEMNKRVGTIETRQAVQEVDMAHLVQIVERLARTVDRYIEYRVGNNGRVDDR